MSHKCVPETQRTSPCTALDRRLILSEASFDEATNLAERALVLLRIGGERCDDLEIGTLLKSVEDAVQRIDEVLLSAVIVDDDSQSAEDPEEPGDSLGLVLNTSGRLSAALLELGEDPDLSVETANELRQLSMQIGRLIGAAPDGTGLSALELHGVVCTLSERIRDELCSDDDEDHAEGFARGVHFAGEKAVAIVLTEGGRAVTRLEQHGPAPAAAARDTGGAETDGSVHLPRTELERACLSQLEALGYELFTRLNDEPYHESEYAIFATRPAARVRESTPVSECIGDRSLGRETERIVSIDTCAGDGEQS